MKTQPGVVKERNQGKEGEKYKGLLGFQRLGAEKCSRNMSVMWVWGKKFLLLLF